MIGLSRGLTVYAYSEACDMRKSFNTLSALVEQQMKQSVLTGDLFLFVSRDCKRAKVLYFDGTGLCLLCKRLSKGRFSAVWKRRRAKPLEMTVSELSLFIEGSESVGRVALSPPLLRKTDLRSRFEPKGSC